MPKEGDTMAVKKIKEGLKRSPSKRTHKQPSEVANQAVQEVANQGAHRQPDRQLPEVAQNAERTQSIGNLKESKVKEDLINKTISKTVLSNSEVDELKTQGLTDAKIAEALDVLLPAYRAEGLTPTSRLLVDSILQLNRDVR